LITFLDFTLILLVLYCKYPGTFVSSEIQEIPDLDSTGFFLDSFGFVWALLYDRDHNSATVAATLHWLHDDYMTAAAGDCESNLTATTMTVLLMASNNFITIRLSIAPKRRPRRPQRGRCLKVVEHVQKEK
jgi:hypothetical protein